MSVREVVGRARQVDQDRPCTSPNCQEPSGMLLLTKLPVALAVTRWLARLVSNSRRPVAVWMVWGYGVPDDVTVIGDNFGMQQYQPVIDTVAAIFAY